MTIARLTLVTLALVLAAGQSPAARGNAVTIRLVVTGATLPQPLTVTDAQILDRSNVYAGGFLGPLVDAVEPAWPQFVVTFIVEPRTPFPVLAPTGVQKTYLVRYARNPETDEGFVYLPGRGEAGYRGNIGIMIRETGDGRWHRATPEWAELLNGYLPRG